jgi:hypothetical protein
MPQVGQTPTDLCARPLRTQLATAYNRPSGSSPSLKFTLKTKMSHFHAVVWIDHQRATVWQFMSTEQANTVIHAHDHN